MRKEVLFIGPNAVRDSRVLRDRIPESIRVEFIPRPTDGAYPDSVETAPIIVNGHPDDAFYSAARNMRVQIVPFAGVQQVLRRYGRHLADSGTVLCNAHWNQYATAQHAAALLLGVCNRLIQHHDRMVNGVWRIFENGDATIPLSGKRVGLLGYGRVNRNVHRILSGFDVTFSVLRRHWRDDSERPDEIICHTPDSVDDFLSEVDILIAALPHTGETDGLLTARRLSLLGEDGIFVNVARGAIVPEGDLFHVLSKKIIRAAAIDVWYDYRPEKDEHGRKYPYTEDHPFHELDNVLLSPHRGASPLDSPHRWDEVVDTIIRFFNGESLLNTVDIAAGY